MKKGTKIKVSHHLNTYGGFEIARTEPYTGYVTLEKGTKLLHGSQKPIKAFAPVETCFSVEEVLEDCLKQSTPEARKAFGSGKEMGRTHCYVLTLPETITVPSFGWEEVRVELEEGWELEYIGYYRYLYLDNPIENKNVSSPREERFIRVVRQYFLQS